MREITVNNTVCTNEKFSLNVQNQCISSATCKSKPLLLSCNLTKNSFGIGLCIHGVIITEILYKLNGINKVHNKKISTPYCSIIYLPKRMASLNSISVKLLNKNIKQIDNHTLIFMFNIGININIFYKEKKQRLSKKDFYNNGCISNTMDDCECSLMDNITLDELADNKFIEEFKLNYPECNCTKTNLNNDFLTALCYEYN